MLRNELGSLQEAEASVWTLISDVFRTIVAGMVLHFLLAIVAGAITYQVMVSLSLIPIYFINRNKEKDDVFAERTVVIVRTILGTLLATMAYFIALYSFAEWLLLILSLLLIAAALL